MTGLERMDESCVLGTGDCAIYLKVQQHVVPLDRCVQNLLFRFEIAQRPADSHSGLIWPYKEPKASGATSSGRSRAPSTNRYPSETCRRWPTARTFGS